MWGEHAVVDSSCSFSLLLTSILVYGSRSRNVANEWRVHWGWYLFRRLLKWLYVHANCWGNININLQNQPHKCCIPNASRTYGISVALSRSQASSKFIKWYCERDIYTEPVSGAMRYTWKCENSFGQVEFHQNDGWVEAQHFEFTTSILIPFICPSKIRTPFALIAYFSAAMKIKVLSVGSRRNRGDFSEEKNFHSQHKFLVGAILWIVFDRRNNNNETKYPSQMPTTNSTIFRPYAF